MFAFYVIYLRGRQIMNDRETKHFHFRQNDSCLHQNHAEQRYQSNARAVQQNQ